MPVGRRAGISTFWQEFGTGERRALALHCGLARSGEWRDVAAALATPLTVVAPDLPGHGKSEDWDPDTDFAALASGVAESFLEHRIDLIGHSLGAVIALLLARRHPDRVRSLTLIEPTLFAAVRGQPAFEAHEALAAPYVRAMDAGDRAQAAAEFTGIWGLGAAAPHHIRAYCEARIHLVAAAASLNHDLTGEILADGGLEELDLPVMLIHGSESPAVIREIAESVASRLPDVGIAEVPGAGHMLPITHAVQVAGLIDVNLTRE